MISTMRSTSVSSRTYDRQKISKRHKGSELVELKVGNKEFTIDKDDYNAIKAIQSPVSWKKAGRSPTGWKAGDDFDERDSDSGEDDEIDSDSGEDKGTDSDSEDDFDDRDSDSGNDFDESDSNSEENFDDKDWDFSFDTTIGNVYDIRSTSVSHNAAFDKKLVFEFGLDDDEERVSYLRILRMYGSMWGSPEALWKLNALRVLDLSCRDLEIIPASIGKLQNLEELYLRYSRVRELPEELWDIPTLRVLDLSYSGRLELPAPVRKEPYLRELILDNTCADVTSSIGLLQNLEKLVLVIEDFEFFISEGFQGKYTTQSLWKKLENCQI